MRNQIAEDKSKKKNKTRKGPAAKLQLLQASDGKLDTTKTLADCLDISSDEETDDQGLSLLFQEKDPEVGDYVLVEYVRKRKVHYVGIVTQTNDDEGDYEIQFLKKSTKHTKILAFVEPEQEEITSVAADLVLGILPRPMQQTTKRLQGITQFGVNFDGYNFE